MRRARRQRSWNSRFSSDHPRVRGFENASVDQAQLLADSRLRLASYKLPREITFVEEFPLTANGKVQRFRMRETMLARRDST